MCNYKSILSVVLLSLMFLNCGYAVTSKEYNNAIKKKLKIEAIGLQKDLNSLGATIETLKADKASITKSLTDMEEWGKNEQQEKIKYYNFAVEYKSNFEAAELKLDGARKQLKKIEDKYDKIKHTMACLAGSLMVFIYFRLNSLLLSIAGLPYFPPIIGILGPVIFFSLGFGAVYLFF